MTTTAMTQPTLFDVCQNRHRNAPTSVEANKRANKAQDRATVLDWLEHRGEYGSTLDEFCAAYDRQPNAVSGRFSELRSEGLITKTTIRRPTRSNCTASVYVLAK